MAESGGSSIGFGNTRYPYYYGPEGRLVLDNNADSGLLANKKNKEVNN
jgi:hypothetical protein